MKPIQGYTLITPDDLHWRPSNLMKIRNASRTCGMERTGRCVPHGPPYLGAPEELEFLQGPKSQMDLSLIYPTDPTQLPKELAGVEWPPK